MLTNTEVLLEKFLESPADGISVMVLDGSLEIRKLNNAFLHLFEIEGPPAPTG